MTLKERFAEFWLVRTHASDEFLRGNALPLARITARFGQVVLFDPRGCMHVGHSNVVTANYRAAKQFVGVRKNVFSPIDIHYGEDVVHWVGTQHSEVLRVDTGEWVGYEQCMVEHYLLEGDDMKWTLRYATPLITPGAP